MGNWGNDDEENSDEGNMFSDEDVKQWIKDGREAKSSNLCVGIYGEDGTGKTGIAMDSRTDEEREEGKEMIIIDVDKSAGSIKQKYFDGDENIIIPPLLEIKEGDRDAVETYNKIDYFTKHLFYNQDQFDLHSVILDGVDEFQDICGDKMQIEDLNKDPNARVKNSWNWQIRNRYYKNIMERIKSMDCHRFFITHMKEKKEAVDGDLKIVGKEVDWHHSTPGMLFQKVHTFREEGSDGKTYFKAKIEKSKGALSLEDKEYTIAEVESEEETSEWNGLMDYWKEVR